MGTNHDGGYIKGVHGLIASQAQLQPRHEAVRHGARVLSFGELDASSSVLARELQRRNIKPNDVVGLHGPRSLEAIVGMLAILKSGAAYVPLDLTHPPARIADIVRDARLTHVVDSDREDAGRPPWAAGVEWIPAALDRGPSSEPLRVPVAPDSIAMVLYTSGSSGRPKGVVLSHRALAARTGTWHAHGVQCQISSLSTVAHIGDLLTPLANGFGILMLDDNTVRDASALARAIQVHHIRRMRFVPSQLRAVLSDPAVVAHLDGVEELIVSGEMVTRALVADTKRALPKARIVNAYGTTETAGMVCAGEIESGARVTIGAPSADWDVHIMDEHLREAVPGALGELCLSGEQLASRYLHDAALTAERFVASPLRDPLKECW